MADDQSRLDGKVALVTGGGTGIGRAAALLFAGRGASVVVAGRRQAEIDEAAHAITAAGGKAAAITADVGDAEQVDALVKGVVAAFGRLDVAFNNAGITGTGQPIVDADEAEFDQVLATNVRGVWLAIRAEARLMIAQGGGGAIVNTSSISATGATRGLSIYAASKGALDSMVRPLALELGAAGIRVNNVSPGVTRTPLTSGIPEEWMTAIGAHAALGRVAEADEVARAAVWLCSPDASFVTGQSLLIDGGFNLAGQR